MQQIADDYRIVDGFPDVLLELQRAVFKDADLQIHLISLRLGHLKPDPHGFAEIHFKRLAGGDFVFVENIENKVAAGGSIAVHIPENLRHMGKLANVIQSIAGAGDQIILRIGTEGDHIGHFIGDFRVSLPCDVDHAGGKIHTGGADAAAVQNLAQDAGAAA